MRRRPIRDPRRARDERRGTSRSRSLVVSKAISDLERTLKVRLVDRTMKGVEPTVYGPGYSTGQRWLCQFEEPHH